MKTFTFKDRYEYVITIYGHFVKDNEKYDIGLSSKQFNDIVSRYDYQLFEHLSWYHIDTDLISTYNGDAEYENTMLKITHIFVSDKYNLIKIIMDNVHSLRNYINEWLEDWIYIYRIKYNIAKNINFEFRGENIRMNKMNERFMHYYHDYDYDIELSAVHIIEGTWINYKRNKICSEINKYLPKVLSLIVMENI